MQSGLLRFTNELCATIVRLFAYVGGLGLMAILGMKVLWTPAVEAAIRSAAPPAWTEVERPLPAFTAKLSGFADPEPVYAIRRHSSGGGRRDIMRWGPAWDDAAAVGSRLMIEVYRPGKEIAGFGDAESSVGKLTGEMDGPYGLTPVDAVDGKFGRFAAFAFTARHAGQPRNCLGFARGFSDPLIQIAGWYCKGAAEIVDRSTPACALERLSLLMAASEPKVTALFARAELRRKPCELKPVRVARSAIGRHRNWIDARKVPKLRGRMAAR